MKSPLVLPALVVALSLLFSPAFTLPAWSAPQTPTAGSPSTDSNVVLIPGPLRSFLRMAGVSQKVPPDEVLPLVAYNVYTRGYEGWSNNHRRMEFLVLVIRYVRQARELTALAGADEVLRVSNCEEGKQLLRILGYRLRGVCGDPHASAVTADPERAFLTIDSGFPLLDLEEALQANHPFAYPYAANRVPVLFSAADWKTAAVGSAADGHDFLDILFNDPALARLYWAMSRMDPETRLVMLQSTGLRSLIDLAPVLDFYGSQLCVRSGRVLVPGGPAAEPAWKQLVGVSPQSPGEFAFRLFSKDRGWAAAYYDALSRASESQQAHFTDPRRLHRLYLPFRGSNPSEAAHQAFRPAPGLLLLVTRLPWDASGEPLIPGNLEIWQPILRQKSDSPVIHDWVKHNHHVGDPEQFLEAMFAFARANTDSGPLQVYLTLADLDQRRPPGHRLHPETVQLLAQKFVEFKDQYLLFLEFPILDDASITRFLTTADSIDKISDHTLRGNAMGTFQANVGLWQILARQGQIPAASLNDSWQALLQPFAHLGSSAQLFDAGRTSLAELLRSAGASPHASQAEIVDLLAGPPQVTPEGSSIHQEIANQMQSVLDGQRLVSLDTLRALGDGLSEMAAGKPPNDQTRSYAKQLREFEMPRPIFTSAEHSQWAAGIYNNHHTDLQMHTDLTKVVKASATPAQLQAARGQLASFLRDSLVGLNYAYYQPPGAQALRHNPLFVRSHDFAGETVEGNLRLWQAPQLIGEGTPAGGGAHFVGSLADLPYELAEVEQDFLAPQNVQALIWKELVPSTIVSSTVPRWWGVSRDQLHAIALYQKAGEELVASSVSNREIRERVLKLLADRLSPQRHNQVQNLLLAGNPQEALAHLTPADTFYLAAEYRLAYPSASDSWGPSGIELANLYRKSPSDLDWEHLSQHFGVPHPTLAHNYGPELLNLKLFPAFSGYSSRLLGETWDSGNLYWARLADEMGYSPVLLNRLAPELTRRMVEKIFATDFEDWEAVLRAMHETGNEFRQGKLASLAPITPIRPQP